MLQERCESWLNRHAWRACVPRKGTVGSNPTLSVGSPAYMVSSHQIHVVAPANDEWAMLWEPSGTATGPMHAILGGGVGCAR